ncbi:unnamed protein product [Orchesella dallaii]|uniref:CCHC-type domain-containing protein n=1 Tax=Orchesella dallaii TaxID=48710 RepID=A0ABP1S776_9HEXA
MDLSPEEYFNRSRDDPSRDACRSLFFDFLQYVEYLSVTRMNSDASLPAREFGAPLSSLSTFLDRLHGLMASVELRTSTTSTTSTPPPVRAPFDSLIALRQELERMCRDYPPPPMSHPSSQQDPPCYVRPDCSAREHLHFAIAHLMRATSNLNINDGASTSTEGFGYIALPADTPPPPYRSTQSSLHSDAEDPSPVSTLPASLPSFSDAFQRFAAPTSHDDDDDDFPSPTDTDSDDSAYTLPLTLFDEPIPSPAPVAAPVTAHISSTSDASASSASTVVPTAVISPVSGRSQLAPSVRRRYHRGEIQLILPPGSHSVVEPPENIIPERDGEAEVARFLARERRRPFSNRPGDDFWRNRCFRCSVFGHQRDRCPLPPRPFSPDGRPTTLNPSPPARHNGRLGRRIHRVLRY